MSVGGLEGQPEALEGQLGVWRVSQGSGGSVMSLEGQPEFLEGQLWVSYGGLDNMLG